MREILFKAKQVDDKKWIEGALLPTDDEVMIATSYLCASDDHEPIMVAAHKVEPETVCIAMEYIIDSKCIFENDIVKYDDCFGIVKFGKYRSSFDNSETEHYGFYIEWKNDRMGLLRKDIGYWMNKRDVKIVGNVFDNPELLKESE